MVEPERNKVHDEVADRMGEVHNENTEERGNPGVGNRFQNWQGCAARKIGIGPGFAWNMS